MIVDELGFDEFLGLSFPRHVESAIPWVSTYFDKKITIIIKMFEIISIFFSEIISITYLCRKGTQVDI